MGDSRSRFQQLLRELFQFDCADLDFGIYRIMNYKRGVIEKFITQDLPKRVAEELERGALAEQAQAAQELQAARQKVLEALGDDALDAEGNLAETYRTTKAGKEYLAAQERARSAKGREALETAIYNHLYTFFSRYYQDGDFISKRRYSRQERYAIPYNGEEVYLYWANHDQYYVKTAEYFTDYTYQAPGGVTVHFKLHQADVEQNNVKGEKRFFLPRAKETAWNEQARQVVIPFEYRPLTAQEEIAYGQKNQQEAIITRMLEELTQRRQGTREEQHILVSSCLGVRHTSADGRAVTYLEHHLRRYTRRNTSDFFIHKDLRGFLSRELDFYLKNEVLNLDEMEAAGEARAEGWFQMMRLIKAIGGQIIEFLDQIERFQKMLWEKRKFITETQYCITVGNIAEAFYPEIAACEAQWQEWERLGFSHGDTKAQRTAYLKAHPTLVLDTKHFDRNFVDRLLGSFDDLDEMTDGLLVHSENWQALNLLQEKYRERVKVTYIDPPYNTGSDEFLYKDNYQHSSWLAMMADRLALAREWMHEDGAIFVSIDDGEQDVLRKALENVFGKEQFVNNIVWQKKFSPQNDARWLSDNHDFLVTFAKRKETWRPGLLPRTEAQDKRYQNPDNDPRGPWMSSDLSVKTYSPEYDYPITTPSGRVVYPPPGRCWFTPKEKMEQLIADNRIWFGPDGNGVPRLKRFLSEIKQGVTPLTIWTYKEVGHNQEGKQELKRMLSEWDEVFGTPKPTRLVQRVITVGMSEKNGWVLDHFAGSGTTGHAVINLNREDGGRRKFILVEMADYFDTVLLPRIKKVAFTPEWKDGKPKRMATQEEAERSPRIVKYICLESYEDALNNIAFDDASGQQAMKFDDYLLKYMLQWETRHSATLLNVEKLTRPFSYKLTIYADGQTREKVVDLPETFNYLLGLDVQTRKKLTQRHEEHREKLGGSVSSRETQYLIYRGVTRHGKHAVVIWRETEGWQQADFERDRRFVTEQKLAEGADEVFVNGDSYIPGARALEPVFKARMFAGVE